MFPLPVLVPLFLAIWPLDGADPLALTFPQEARGDIRFQADVVLFEEEGVLAPEVTIAVPREALSGEGRGDSTTVAVTVEMLDAGGEARARYATEFIFAPDSLGSAGSTFPVPERWLRLHPRWLEGTVGIRVSVADLGRAKVGLVDKLRGTHPTGIAEGRLDWPALRDSSGLAASGVLFAWAQAEGSGRGGAGLRDVRSRLQPNPFRYYGKFQPVLTVYWERYGVAPGLEVGAQLRLVHEISAVGDSVSLVRTTDPAVAEPGARWELRRFDVSQLPSGAYWLEARIEDADGRVLATTAGGFQVVWEERRWTDDERTILDYAQLVLDPAEYDSLLVLDRGGQEEFLRRFWNRRVSTPPGAENPLEAEFLRRIDLANREFGSRFRQGFKTDRGRVFVRLGPPDEISFNLNPQDRETLAYVLPEVIEDPTEDLRARLRQARTRSVRDARAYEIWEYTVQGAPLIPEFTGMQQGLKFVFADEHGYGEYVLIYTNLPGSLR